MKKFIVAAALSVMSLCFADRISAGNFGILAGANFYTKNVKEINSQNMTKWHAGVTYKMNLPLGFHLQPSLLYNVKNMNSYAENLSVGYLELMASVQWGVDLILFRPFIDVSPFVGYGLNSWGDFTSLWSSGSDKFEYGVGLGGGLDIWRFQLTARYNWSFGMLNKGFGSDTIRNADFGGVTLTVAYFF